MPRNLGTRTQANQTNNRLERESETRTHTRDKGMSKRVVASITFTGGNGRASAANGTFVNTFALGDPVLIGGTNLNNGFFEIVGLDAGNNAFLTLDPPPKDEGPVTCEIRTA